MKKRLFRGPILFVEIERCYSPIISPSVRGAHICFIRDCYVRSNSSYVCRDCISFSFDTREELDKFYYGQIDIFMSVGFE